MPVHQVHTGKWFWGGLLLILGILFLADNLKYLDSGEIISTYWPLLLVYFGVTILAKGRSSLFWGLGLVGVGLMLVLGNTGIIRGEVWDYVWPGLLILAGLAVIFQSGKRGPACDGVQVLAGRLDHSVSFSKADYASSGEVFDGGRISASFSEARVDLSNATPGADRMELQVDCSFGHVLVVLPATWRCELNVRAGAGSAQDNRVGVAGSGPTVVIKGSVSFGSLDVVLPGQSK